MRNIIKYGVWIICSLASLTFAQAQYYDESYYQDDSGAYSEPQQSSEAYQNQGPPASTYPSPNLQYDSRDAERILREQMTRATQPPQQDNSEYTSQQPEIYDNYYGHRIHDEGQIQRVLAEARTVGGFIRNRNGKAFIVIDKRNFQYYLYDRDGRLLRIGPVAIGKGKTRTGAFETPVGIFPIKSKVAVADWVRPDWYFLEEGEPIPANWEERRVPGFFRYKLVFDGSRYIHYAEATGGRLTHGCLGLDWQDAEAVFHTLSVGSYCIVVDDGLLARLARGEFPLPKPVAKQPQPDEPTFTARSEPSQVETVGVSQSVDSAPRPRPMSNLW
ncbi:MAG: L,D-transpeptidase [Desulfomonilaceae bacterium]